MDEKRNIYFDNAEHSVLPCLKFLQKFIFCCQIESLRWLELIAENLDDTLVITLVIQRATVLKACKLVKSVK